MPSIGEVVRLKSGGPAMTVNGRLTDGLSCVWFAGDERREGRFAAEALEPAPPPPGEKPVITKYPAPGGP